MFRIFIMLGVGLLVTCSLSLNALSAENDYRGQGDEAIYEGTLSGTVGELLFRGLPSTSATSDQGDKAPHARVASNPTLVDRRQMNSLLNPSDMTSVGNLASEPETKFKFVGIEVSHSEHTFKLFGVSQPGKPEILYQCKIGLGSPEFPTPVGTYFVTHIYDDNPWWIPPKDRAWAAGDSPSKTVYGGTMAPLLKKRPATRKKINDPEDLIEDLVKFDDYGYRFHGTNAPGSIGYNQSHGCVRMLSKDAKQVASIIKDVVGTADRRESENGTYVILNAPVRLNLVK